MLSGTWTRAWLRQCHPLSGQLQGYRQTWRSLRLLPISSPSSSANPTARWVLARVIFIPFNFFLFSPQKKSVWLEEKVSLQKPSIVRVRNYRIFTHLSIPLPYIDVVEWITHFSLENCRSMILLKEVHLKRESLHQGRSFTKSFHWRTVISGLFCCL